MTLSMDDDARDLAAVKAGDPAAFARVYDRHAAIVLSICRRGGAADADDALQETFIRAFRLLDWPSSPADLRRWLYGIARRVCSEQRRAASRRGRHESQAAMHQREVPSAAAPHAGAERAEQFCRLEAALDRLPDDERLAIHLFYLEHDPVPAASHALGVSRSGFYKLLDRARPRPRVPAGGRGGLTCQPQVRRLNVASPFSCSVGAHNWRWNCLKGCTRREALRLRGCMAAHAVNEVPSS